MVAENLDIVAREIRNGNKEDALIFLQEIILMRDFWANIAKRPTRIFTTGSFASGYKFSDAGAQKASNLAQERKTIANKAIRIAVKRLQSVGWIN